MREGWQLTENEARLVAQRAIRVERLGPTPAQVLANVERRLLDGVPRTKVANRSVEVPWWRDLIGDFSLPTAGALEDALPDILRDGFDEYLGDDDKRTEVTATEAALRKDAAAESVRLLRQDEDG